MAVLLPGKFLYLALPHTATCATMNALYNGIEGCYASRINEVGDVPPDRGFDLKNQRSSHHLTRAELIERRPEIFKGNETVVSTVRHPCDLIATWWLRQKKTISLRHKVPEPSLLDYIEMVEEGTPGGPYIRFGHMYWMKADTYLRYESLQHDLDRLLEGLGLPTVQLARINVTKDKVPWQTYFTEKELTAVRDRFGTEAARFGYEIP